jgi:hypothetical protein
LAQERTYLFRASPDEQAAKFPMFRALLILAIPIRRNSSTGLAE